MRRTTAPGPPSPRIMPAGEGSGEGASFAWAGGRAEGAKGARGLVVRSWGRSGKQEHECAVGCSFSGERRRLLSVGFGLAWLWPGLALWESSSLVMVGSTRGKQAYLRPVILLWAQYFA